MWQVYLAALGLPTDLAQATAPSITPVPSNQPRRSIGDFPQTCYHTTIVPEDCSIIANSVELLYWPPTIADSTPTVAMTGLVTRNETVSARQQASIAVPPAITPTATTVHHGLTLTYPSVYISFDWLVVWWSATPTCTQTILLGATTGIATLPRTQEIFSSFGYNIVLNLDPRDVSSIIIDPGPNTAGFISSVVRYSQLSTYAAYLTEARNYTPLQQPSPEAYYLNPGALYIESGGADRGFIIDKSYAPNLAVPSSLHEILPPKFRLCSWPSLALLYDPPSALNTPTESLSPTVPPAGLATAIDQTSEQQTSPQTPSLPPSPASLPTVSSPQETAKTSSFVSHTGTPLSPNEKSSTIENSAAHTVSPNTVQKATKVIISSTAPKIIVSSPHVQPPSVSFLDDPSSSSHQESPEFPHAPSQTHLPTANAPDDPAQPHIDPSAHPHPRLSSSSSEPQSQPKTDRRPTQQPSPTLPTESEPAPPTPSDHAKSSECPVTPGSVVMVHGSTITLQDSDVTSASGRAKVSTPPTAKTDEVRSSTDFGSTLDLGPSSSGAETPQSTRARVSVSGGRRMESGKLSVVWSIGLALLVFE